MFSQVRVRERSKGGKRLEYGRLPRPILAEQDRPLRRLPLAVGQVERLLLPEAAHVLQAQRQEVRRLLLRLRRLLLAFAVRRLVRPLARHDAHPKGNRGPVARVTTGPLSYSTRPPALLTQLDGHG